MWSLAVTAGATELLVCARLRSQGLEVFCPYTREKQRVKVFIPATRANPRPRTQFKVIVREEPRWPRYVFARTPTDDDLNTLVSVRDVRSIVRGSEGLPSQVTDKVIDLLRTGCAPDGLVLKRSEILRYSVKDLLRFVAPSPFSGMTGEVQSTERLDDNGELTLVVGNFPVSVHYTEVERQPA